ncbi:MAG: hypothetical protein ABJI43_15410 [Roseobacter sp.]
MNHPYTNLGYAQSLAGPDQIVVSETLGVPLRLRVIPGSDLMDAAGIYPISPNLRKPPPADLKVELQRMGAVTLVLVSDPLVPVSPSSLFDILRPYKPHHVIDHSVGPANYSKHHRAEVRRARRKCTARQINLADHLKDFTGLYDVLIGRHGLAKMHRFDAAHFAHLAANPQAFPTFGAFVDSRLVSAHIWARDDTLDGAYAYSHLAASDDEGYATGAAYAVNDEAIRSMRDCKMITLGGAPDGATGDGLDRFKRGFANTTLTSFLCGVIAEPTAYNALSSRIERSSRQAFFPIYRQPLPPH